MLSIDMYIYPNILTLDPIYIGPLQSKQTCPWAASKVKGAWFAQARPSRDGARSENLGGQVVMRRAAATRRCLLFCQNLGVRTSSKNIPKSFAYLADATNTKIWHISGSTLSTHLVTVSLFWVIISQSDFPYFPQFRQTLYGFIIWRYHLKLRTFIQIIFLRRISWRSAQL